MPKKPKRAFSSIGAFSIPNTCKQIVMQIVNRKFKDHRNYIFRIVKPLSIQWYIAFDCSSFSFSTVALNLEPYL